MTRVGSAKVLQDSNFLWYMYFADCAARRTCRKSIGRNRCRALRSYQLLLSELTPPGKPPLPVV